MSRMKTAKNEVERLIKKAVREMKIKEKHKDTQQFYEKNIRSDMEYENSPEGVWDDLQVWGEVLIEDTDNRRIIAETLLELPYKVRRKVLDEVIFIIMAAQGLARQHVLPVTVRKSDFKQINKEYYQATIEHPFIYLNFKKHRSKSSKMDTIAHEIAHFMLGHHSKTSNRLKQKEKTYERKADDLSEKWGFKRCYKDYSF